MICGLYPRCSREERRLTPMTFPAIIAAVQLSLTYASYSTANCLPKRASMNPFPPNSMHQMGFGTSDLYQGICCRCLGNGTPVCELERVITHPDYRVACACRPSTGASTREDG